MNLLVAFLVALLLGPRTSGSEVCTAPVTQEQERSSAYEAAKKLFDDQDFAAAAKAFRNIVEADAGSASAWFYLGYSLHVMGDLEEALAAHIEASKDPRTRKPAMYNAACACSLLGRKDEAFEWLERAVAAGFSNTQAMRTDPDLAALRSDPRFAKYVPEPIPEGPVFRGEVRVIHTFVGEAAGDQFGWEGRNTGDCDGDGKDDILISAPYKSVGGPNAGRIYVYSGATGKLLFAQSGKPGEYLGIGISAAGDVNGDGFDDALVGATNQDGGEGRAYVYSGKDGTKLLTLSAGEPRDRFGWKVATAGDVNDDGHDDVMVGAPGSDAAGEDAGAFYLFSGKNGDLLLALDGEEPGDAFGGCVAGRSKGPTKLLAVGAGNAGPGDRGRVYVYRYADEDVVPAFTFDADETGANLARMFLSIVGDVDADGFPDVYASDWENNAHGKSTGRIYVHSGRNGERLLTLTGERAGDGFGIGTAETGDVDGDGHDDLLIGAWQNGEGGPSAGKCYLFSGREGVLMRSYVCAAPGDTFGFDAAGMGDLDGDGGVDFVITSAWSNFAGPKAGRVFVIAGPRREAGIEASVKHD